MYLKAITSPTWSQAIDLLKTCLNDHPGFAPAIVALASDDAQSGRMESAAALVNILSPEAKVVEDTDYLERLIRNATTPRDALIDEFQQVLSDTPTDTKALIAMIDVLSSSPTDPRINNAVRDWKAAIQDYPGVDQAMVLIDHIVDAIQEVPLETPVEEFTSLDKQSLAVVMMRLIHSGRLNDAAALYMDNRDQLDSTVLIFLVAANDVIAVKMSAGAKAIILADLARRFPDNEAEYAKAARKLLSSRFPPFQIVKLLFSKP